jgi:hypothetical protein
MLGIHNLGPKFAVLLRCRKAEAATSKACDATLCCAHCLLSSRVTAHATVHLAALVSGGVAVQLSRGASLAGPPGTQVGGPGRAGLGYARIQSLSPIRTGDSN